MLAVCVICPWSLWFIFWLLFLRHANRKNKGPKSPDVRVYAQRRGGSRRWGCGGARDVRGAILQAGGLLAYTVWVRSQLWDLYHDLKHYKLDPNPEAKLDIEERAGAVAVPLRCWR